MGFQNARGVIPRGIGHYRPTSLSHVLFLPHLWILYNSPTLSSPCTRRPPPVINRPHALSFLVPHARRLVPLARPPPQSENDTTCSRRSNAKNQNMRSRVRHRAAAATAAAAAMSLQPAHDLAPEVARLVGVILVFQHALQIARR